MLFSVLFFVGMFALSCLWFFSICFLLFFAEIMFGSLCSFFALFAVLFFVKVFPSLWCLLCFLVCIF